MNGATLWKAKDPDLFNSLAAMRRAAHSAREQAVRTGTDVLVVRDGRLVRLTADELWRSGVR
jgi:hypothetical protein